MKDNKIIQLTPDVSWVGILDRDIVTFDIVMETEYGTTYNSYFIDAEKKTLIETAKEKFWDVYKSKLEQIVNISELDYIVLDHTEPDHSGSLVHLLKLAPNVTVVGSGQAIRYLNEIVGKPFKHIIVKHGDTLDLGNKTLEFIGAPNLHWPDTIYTYLKEDKILFTCDSFGAHYCSDEIFDGQVDRKTYLDAFKYYFDVILKPFSKFMLKAIDKIKDLDIEMIAPGHGPILKDHWKEMVALSKEYSETYMNQNDLPSHRVLISYVSAYGYTNEMAEAMAEGIREEDLDVKLLDIETIDMGELESEIVRSDAFMVGCPTLNQNILLPVYRMFALINPIRDKGKIASSFGSYGWSGEGVKIMQPILQNLKLKTPLEPMAMKFRPNEDNKSFLKAYGKEFAQAVKA
ncbi:MAG: FprA family A-type flavoprotein [Bacteroidota bacterium]|nr:FprA family A-type flavoprotein [Bacteroidota bacterium]